MNSVFHDSQNVSLPNQKTPVKGHLDTLLLDGSFQNPGKSVTAQAKTALKALKASGGTELVGILNNPGTEPKTKELVKKVLRIFNEAKLEELINGLGVDKRQPLQNILTEKRTLSATNKQLKNLRNLIKHSNQSERPELYKKSDSIFRKIDKARILNNKLAERKESIDELKESINELKERLNSSDPSKKPLVQQILNFRLGVIAKEKSIDELRAWLKNLDPSEKPPVQEILNNKVVAKANEMDSAKLRDLLSSLDPSERPPIQRILNLKTAKIAANKRNKERYGDHFRLTTKLKLRLLPTSPTSTASTTKEVLREKSNIPSIGDAVNKNTTNERTSSRWSYFGGLFNLLGNFFNLFR